MGGVRALPAPLFLFAEVVMLDFISDCAGLFSLVFNAACSLDYFRFLAAFVLLLVCLGVFLLIYHGSKKL